MKAFSSVLIFAISLACTAALLSRVLPPVPIPQFSEKIAWFAAHKDDYDAVFIGSSQFYHGIDPLQFDRDAGLGKRSFNFGLDGLWPAESFFVLRQILAQHSHRLRWVFIDWMDIDPRIDPGGTTRRMIHWHDTRHTAITLRRIVGMPDLWEKKASLAGTHLGLWMRRLLHHGEAVEWFEGKLRTAKRVRARIPDWAEQDGWRPGKRNGIEGPALTEYLAQLEVMRDAGARPSMDAAFESALRDIAAEVRAAGATPILIASPAPDTRQRFAPPAGIEAWIFNDPAHHPELFDPRRHYDIYHLNPQGAETFTRLLAGRFAESQTPRP